VNSDNSLNSVNLLIFVLVKCGVFLKLQDGELHNMYSSPDIIRQMKSRRMKWAGHVARMGEGRNLYRVLVGKPKIIGHLKDQGADGRME
jgi:hypothetical protein